LHKTTFNTGAHHPTTSKLLPLAPTVPSPDSSRTSGSSPDSPPPQVLLLASPTGVLATLRPVTEAAYRRLSSLAGQLTTSLPHPAGLNPKGYRVPSPSCPPSGVDAGVGRTIIDGAILERFTELGTGRRGEIAGRAGYGGAGEVRTELEGVIRWSGFGYF